jgi:RNA polymerase sigma-70 factor, ECF subfamily
VEPAEKKLLQFPGNTKPEAQMNAEPREDARLLARIAGKCHESLAALYDRRGGLLYSLLARMLLSESEAQEIMQDTFVQIWRRAAEYDPRRSSPLGWMIMIARGLAVDRLRARLRRRATQQAYEREVASLAIEEMTGAHHAEHDEMAAACVAALHKLPEPQARALQLAFLRGWTHEEIARAEGQPLGTVKARIRRGLLALRQALREYHG